MSADLPGIRVSDLSVAIDGTAVLSNIDLDLAAGSHLALLGPSGCGKTTLLRTIAGLQRAGTGEVAVGGRIVDSSSTFVEPEQRNVGLVFQNGALFPHMSVRRNVEFGLRRSGERTTRAAEALDLVGMSDYADRSPETLSGGQRQRVALARALAPRPDVLLLDEPFASLDAALRVELRTHVTELLRSLNITSVLVTHDQDEAFVSGETVAIMSHGRIEQIGPPADVYNDPQTRFVATFLGDANLIPGQAGGPHADTAFGRIPLRESLTGAVDVVVRPEQLRLLRDGAASVRSVEYFGHDCLYSICADGVTISVRETSAPRFSPGDHVAVSHSGSEALAFPSTIDTQGRHS